MAFKDFLKRIMPISIYRSNQQYETLKKQNEEMLKLMHEETSRLEELIQLEKKRNATQTKRYKRTADEMRQLERVMCIGKYGLSLEKRSPQIVVSMTSYGSRIYSVPVALERLLCQTLKPDRIVLYLSKDNFPNQEADLPVQLLEFKEYGVEIRWCDGDIKSYKKIVPALKEFPDDIIITVDDDIFYRFDMVERLYHSYLQFPHAISACRVHKMTFDKSGNLNPYAKWKKLYTDEILVPSMQLFATTGAGTLFPPHCLHNATVDESLFMRLAPNADDIWIKIMSILNHTPTVVVGRFGEIQCVEGTQENRLWDTNQVENDKQLQQVMEHFQDALGNEKTLLDLMKEE